MRVSIDRRSLTGTSGSILPNRNSLFFPPTTYLVQMFFFARPPSCASFTRLLAFRVTRTSQPPQHPKSHLHFRRTSFVRSFSFSLSFFLTQSQGTSLVLSYDCELL